MTIENRPGRKKGQKNPDRVIIKDNETLKKLNGLSIMFPENNREGIAILAIKEFFQKNEKNILAAFEEMTTSPISNLLENTEGEEQD